MYIINEWIRYCDNPEEERESPWEYELRCRVHFIGIVNLGWAKFQFWDSPLLKVKSDVRSVVLRMKFRKVDYEEFMEIPNKKDQHYHPSGPAGEFESLITLFTRSHFVLTKGTSTGSVPLLRRFSSSQHVAYSDVDGSEIRWEHIQSYFDMMYIIRKSELQEIREKQPSDRYIKKFMMAARFYHLALSLMDHDETLAYICLVSSIECMIANYKIKHFGFQDVYPDAYKLLNEAISNKHERESIEKAILEHTPKVKLRFVNFIQDHLSDEFWQDDTRPPEPFRFKDKEDVSEHIRRVYDTRSKAIHSGNPFPRSSGNDEHQIGSLQIGQKEWKEKEMVPSLRAFERLVHHVLLESLRKHQLKIKEQ